MLTALSIRDVVLIERLDLAFGPGLTVLTGETGAGKSILLDSLGLALGARAEAGLVRAGAEQASVTACFSPPPGHPVQALLDEQGLETEDDIVLRRMVRRDGRSRAFINDQPVGVGAAAPRRCAAGGGAGPARANGPGRSGQPRRLAGCVRRAGGAGHRGARGLAALARGAGRAGRGARGDRRGRARRGMAAPRGRPNWPRWRRATARKTSSRAERQRLQQSERRAEAIAAALSEIAPRDRRSAGPASARCARRRGCCSG